MSKKDDIKKKIDALVETVPIDEKLYEKAEKVLKKEQAAQKIHRKSAGGWGLGQGVPRGSRRLFG
jgi:hypothetical protein